MTCDIVDVATLADNAEEREDGGRRGGRGASAAAVPGAAHRQVGVPAAGQAAGGDHRQGAQALRAHAQLAARHQVCCFGHLPPLATLNYADFGALVVEFDQQEKFAFAFSAFADLFTSLN